MDASSDCFRLAGIDLPFPSEMIGFDRELVLVTLIDPRTLIDPGDHKECYRLMIFR